MADASELKAKAADLKKLLKQIEQVVGQNKGGRPKLSDEHKELEGNRSRPLKIREQVVNHEAIERFRSLINNGQRTFVERRDGKVFEFENWGTPATREDIEGVGWVYGVEEYEARFKK